MSEPRQIGTETRGALGVIYLCNAPVNALGHALRTAIGEAHAAFCADPEIKAIALVGLPKFFSAGADIREFATGRKPPLLTEVIAKIEAAPKPTLALIGGVCFGGGFELALACDIRLAAPNARFSFPELRLGNIPGAGGTQKLPRLVGGPAALDIIVTAREVRAKEAAALGLCDEVLPDLEAALVRAEALVAAGVARQPIGARAVPGVVSDMDAAAETALGAARGALAVARAVEGVRMAYDTPLEQGQAWERETFIELNASDQSRAQRHVFFAEREARKVPDVPPGTETREITRVAVVGAGHAGTGIALRCARAGLRVVLIDTDAAQIERAQARIAELWDQARDGPEIDEATLAAWQEWLELSTDLSAAASAELVVATVSEDMAQAQAIFSALGGICRPGAILACDGASLDLDRIAQATGRPGDVIGLRFAPSDGAIRLLEVVRGAWTAPEVSATVMALAPRLDTQPVLVGIGDGTVSQRMVCDLGREMRMLVEEGATPGHIDAALAGFGWDVGPHLRAASAGAQDCPAPGPDIEGRAMADPAQSPLTEEEIRRRCLWQLVNSGCRILEAGIARRASDLDVIFVHGDGFPRFRGGPMFHAEAVGLSQVLADIRRYHETLGPRWAPAPLLERAVREGLSLEAALAPEAVA